MPGDALRHRTAGEPAPQHVAPEVVTALTACACGVAPQGVETVQVKEEQQPIVAARPEAGAGECSEASHGMKPASNVWRRLWARLGGSTDADGYCGGRQAGRLVTPDGQEGRWQA